MKCVICESLDVSINVRNFKSEYLGYSIDVPNVEFEDCDSCGESVINQKDALRIDKEMTRIKSVTEVGD